MNKECTTTQPDTHTGSAGRVYRAIRRATGLTRTQAGELIGVSASTIGRIERDEADGSGLDLAYGRYLAGR